MHAMEARANEAGIKAKAAEALVVAEKKRCYIEKETFHCMRMPACTM